MEALFLKLVNMSISASWLVLAVVVLRFAMKKAPKWMTCALWIQVAIRLVFPFSIESMFSLVPDPEPIPQTVVTNQTPIVVLDVAPSPADNATIPVEDLIAGGHAVPVTPASITELAATVWIIGVSVLLIYALVSYLLIQRKVSASLHLRDNLYLCDYIESPFILGILQPNIYLPSSLDQAQWPHVIAHEKAHLHRRDHWWKPLGFMILCVYWFNPVLWLAYILLCRDIELACDERVIRDMDTAEKKAYTTALLECSMPRYLIAACPLAFGEVGVKERVKSVLNYKKPAFWIILIALVLCVAAAVCFLTDPVTEPDEPNAEFTATVVENSTTWITVEPDPGTVERNSSDRIQVSLYWHHSDGTIYADGVLGEFHVGDRVKIVYDGQIQETYPARISNTFSVEKVGSVPPQYKSIEEAIMDGCVAMVNSDAVAGQQRWQDFMILTEQGLSATVRFVTYHTLSSPANYDPGDFPEAFQQYPLLYVHDLSYDGNQYTLRSYGDGTERISEWPYLVHYSDVEYGPTYRDYYLLTNTPDLSWTDYTSSIAVSFTPIRSYPLYSDILYEDEPNQTELEIAKTALEPYMLEYKISSLDANELTHRLDVSVYEWVDGLDSLIAQFLDLDFVTITHQKGTLEFTDQPTVATQFSATVLEVNDGSILVEPLPGTVNHPSMDRLRVTRTLADSGETVHGIAVGDIVSILYDGMIAESYPGQINTVYDIQVLPDHPDAPKEPISPPEISIEVTHATATEALIVYHINNLGDREVMTGYEYHLEVLTEDGWVHYGYPLEELAWEDALLFRTGNHYPENSQNAVIFVADWSRTADAPLPPGTYRYCKNVMILYGDEIDAQSCYAVFEVPEDSPEDPGVHMEILNPTDTGATLAITYNGGLMGELSTQGKFYLMVDVGNGGTTKYGMVPSQVDWDSVLYTLPEGETVYLDIRWDHTADAPLPAGTYYVVLVIDQAVPYSGSSFHFDKYITEPFAITD